MNNRIIRENDAAKKAGRTAAKAASDAAKKAADAAKAAAATEYIPADAVKKQRKPAPKKNKSLADKHASVERAKARARKSAKALADSARNAADAAWAAAAPGSSSKNESRMPSKRLIRMTESDLRQIVKESVKRIIREEIDELSYGKVKAAHDKMKELGQTSRARDLAHTFADVYNDEDARYNMGDDTIDLSTISNGKKEFGDYDYNRDGKLSHTKAATYTRSRANSTNPGRVSYGGLNNPHRNFADPRVYDAKSAINRARHLNNFARLNPEDKDQFTKNDFRM